MPVHPPASAIGHYRIIDPHLGSGSFGSVSLAEDNITRNLVAIKCVAQSEWDEAEYTSLSSLSHPNILRLRDYYFLSGKHYLVTDYARGGDLFDFLEGKPRIEEHIACHIFRQLAECIQFIHASGFAHRDLKLENIFLDGDHQHVILGDWGFALRCSPNVQLRERCGTLFYLAPEMLDNSGYQGPDVDMWSLGVLLYYLLVGNLPFDGSSDAETEYLILRNHVHFPGYLSKNAVHLLQSLLCPCSARINSHQLVNHPWLKNDTTPLCIDDCESKAWYTLGKVSKRAQPSSVAPSPKKSRTAQAPEGPLSPFSIFESLPSFTPIQSSSSFSPSLFDQLIALPLCSLDDDSFSPLSHSIPPRNVDSVY